MNAAQGPQVVAELGRPETPQETADRRAEASRKRRQNNNLLNLVLALAASLAVVAIVVLMVVRPDAAPQESVDYRTIAADSFAPVPLAAPVVPANWWSNSAIFEGAPADGVANWYVGFVTPTDKFIALRQGIDANPTWLANELSGMKATGVTTIDDIEWTVYDRRGTKDVGLREYGLTTVSTRSTYVVYGTASDEEFTTLAKELAGIITADR